MKFNILLVVILLIGAVTGTEARTAEDYGSKPQNAFHNISLTTAKQMATRENKQIFVEFYADWCVPCKWMEETTFADPSVQQALKENYIAVRVDIDDFDGFALKQHYEIAVLPTMLILDPDGRTLERKEQSLSADMLLQLLTTESNQQVKVQVNSSPSAAIKQQNNKKQEEQWEPPVPVVSPGSTNHATVKTTTYRVQVGVFTDYANTEKMVDELRSYMDEPIIVLNDYLNNKTVFKVLVGDFEDKSEASVFKNKLWQNYGIDGFVK